MENLTGLAAALAIPAFFVVYIGLGWIYSKRHVNRWGGYTGRRNVEICLERHEQYLSEAERIGENGGYIFAAKAAEAAGDMARHARDGGPALGWARWRNEFWAGCAERYEFEVQYLRDTIAKEKSLLVGEPYYKS